MALSDALTEPLDGYNSVYKAEHLKNTEETFDKLVEKSKIDVEANKRTVAEYRKKLAEINDVKKLISKAKGLRTFIIVLCVLVGVVGVGVLLSSIQGGAVPLWAGILVMVAAVGIIITLSVVVIRKLTKKIKNNEEVRNKLQAEADALLKEAWAQMAPLNALYDWGIPQSIVTKTVPAIEMDKNFDEERFTYLREKFGFGKNTDETCSTQFCQSGAIHGNPFLILKDLRQSWIQQLYTGSLVIHWTTTVRTQNGTRTVHHTQTLTASITRPKPVYGYDTYLVYGNEAAPNLSFSRAPSGASGLSEKQIQKKVASSVKQLDKKARKAVSAGSSYTRLGNDEFEVLFGGTNRNNEVEYRMLFTPLAQKSLLKLIKTPEPYGDDFTVQKNKKLNYVRTKHAQTFDYDITPMAFVNYDYEAARANFITINTAYFRSFYFDIAPLMSIPLYQQHKTREFIYDMPYSSNISSYEHEAVANAFNHDLMRPAGAITPSILKTNLISKHDNADTVGITAHAFRGERRITYIPRFGGDGRTHMVPVVWIEYFPIERTTSMAVQKRDSTRLDMNMNSVKQDFKDMLSTYSDSGAWLYERGVFAMFTGKTPLNSSAVKNINKVYEAAEVAEAAMTTDADLEELAQIIAAEAGKRNTAELTDDSEKLLNDETAATKEVEASDEELKEPAEDNADGKAEGNKENPDADDGEEEDADGDTTDEDTDGSDDNSDK